MIFSSCESFFDTVVEIDPPPHTPQLAVHAHGGNANGGEVKIMVSNTFGILEDVDQNLLDRAEISLSTDGQVFNFIHLTSSNIEDTLYLSDTTVIADSYGNFFKYYSSDFIPVPGKKYTLNVSHPDFPPVRAEQTAPYEVVPDSAIYIIEAGNDQSGERTSAVDIYFRDPPGVENFYEVRIYNYTNSFYLDLQTSEPGSLTSYLDFALFSDKVFDGQQKRLRINFYPVDFAGDPSGLVVRWRSISPETFKFNEAMIKYFDSVNNPFLTPTQIYTNIENGVGVFSLYYETLIETRQ